MATTAQTKRTPHPLYGTFLRAVGMVVLIVFLVVFANYVGGALFLIVHKINPALHFPYSAWDAWSHYQAYPQYLKSLRGSSLAGVAASGGLVFLGYSATASAKRNLHGDARYARHAEITAAGLFSDNGIILGKSGNKFLILGGQQFVVLAAPPRSGKGAGVVIPNLLTFDGSVVVLDIKKENWTLTAGYRAAHGQAVFLFDPFSAHTHRQNPLSYISKDPLQRVSDASAIAMALYPDPPKGDPFWQQQARNLALGLILLLTESPQWPCTIGELARQATGKSKTLPDHLKHIIDERSGDGAPLSVACQDCLYRFMSNAENTLSSILSALNAPLSLWTNPLVDAATSASDFDWRNLRRNKMSVYVAVQPGKLAEASFLINMMMTQMININTDVLPEADPSLKHQALLVFDEFTAFGKIPIIERAAGYMAGYNLRLLLVIQSVAQLKSVYGDDATKTLIDSSAAQIIFPPKDIKEAQVVSETIGYLGQHTSSKGRSHSAGGMQRGSSRSRSENISEQRRALLLPQEVRELPKTTCLIFAEYLRPISATKIRWFEDPTFSARQLPPPNVAALDVQALLDAIEGQHPHASTPMVVPAGWMIPQAEHASTGDASQALVLPTGMAEIESGESAESDERIEAIEAREPGEPIERIELDRVGAHYVESVPLRAMYPGDLSPSDIEEIATSVFDCFDRSVVRDDTANESENESDNEIGNGNVIPINRIQGL